MTARLALAPPFPIFGSETPARVKSTFLVHSSKLGPGRLGVAYAVLSKG
jgi:hypothetical protein